MRCRRRSSSLLKQEFLEKWIKCLRSYNNSANLNKEMNILERKKVIKRTADIAMASATSVNTRWSRTLLLMANANSSSDDDDDDTTKLALVQHVTAGSDDQLLKAAAGLEKSSTRSAIFNIKRARSKRVVKRSCRARRVGGGRDASRCIARKLMKRRTQVLKSLVPGGVYMDDVSLIRETLDYIASLRVQVDVMRSLANAR